MNKPLTVARQEFLDNIAMIINQTPLPAFVIAEMLDVALKRVNLIAEQEYRQDKAMWEESLKKTEKEKPITMTQEEREAVARHNSEVMKRVTEKETKQVKKSQEEGKYEDKEDKVE